MMTFPLSARRVASGWWCCLGLVLLVGCRENESIVRYQAPKPVVVEAPATRTMGAILPRGDQAWFFKLTGLAVQVEQVTDSFRGFLQTVEFDAAGTPSWPLPEGWRERAGDAIRFRTLLMSTDVNPLEISVTRLPLLESDLDDYLLSNINRWRDQLSLGGLSKDELSSHMETLTIDGDQPAYLVDFEGRGMARAPAMPPMAGTSGSGASGAPSPSPPAAGGEDGSSDIAYEAPPGWQDTGSGGFRAASFRVGEEGESAEITVIALGPNSGSILDNVNRWRGQVRLEPLTAEQLDADTQSLDAQNAPGTYVALHGPDDGGKQESILGVILPREDRVWFVKMTGNTVVVQREQAHFESFTQSLRLP
jgi:hypothetical protein